MFVFPFGLPAVGYIPEDAPVADGLLGAVANQADGDFDEFVVPIAGGKLAGKGLCSAGFKNMFEIAQDLGRVGPI